MEDDFEVGDESDQQSKQANANHLAVHLKQLRALNSGDPMVRELIQNTEEQLREYADEGVVPNGEVSTARSRLSATARNRIAELRKRYPNL